MVVIDLGAPRDKLVGDFISDCIILDSSTPILKAIGLMKNNDSYEVFSHAGNKVGVVTVRDILKSKSPSNMKVKNLMKFVPKISIDNRLLQAAKIMAEYRLRALPVFHGGKVIGKIDVKSIVNEIKNSALGNIRASKIMSPSPVTMSVSERVSKAREIMIRRRIDHIPIIKGRRISGIVTSSNIVFDLMTEFDGEKYRSGVPDTLNPLDSLVEAIMSKNPLECDPPTPIRDVAENMLNQSTSYSLVTVGEELHGIITYRDFAKLISAGDIEVNFPLYIIGLPDDPFEAEAAKIKFIRLVNSLSKILPQIIEARSMIKTSSQEGERRHYEVSVNIIAVGRETYNYSANGWDLPSIYDDVANAIKKMAITKRKVERRRRSRQPIDSSF